MTTKIIAVLAGISLLGTIALIWVGKPTDVVIPILTACVGWLLSSKSDAIGAKLGGIFK